MMRSSLPSPAICRLPRRRRAESDADYRETDSLVRLSKIGQTDVHELKVKKTPLARTPEGSEGSLFAARG